MTRERSSEDPWTVACRVVHDLRRDGIRVEAGGEAMSAAAGHAAALLEALGVAAAVPDEDGPGTAQPGGGWITGPSVPPR